MAPISLRKAVPSARILLATVGLALTGCGAPVGDPDLVRAFRQLHQSEELHLALSQRLGGLDESAMNLRIPGQASRRLFDSRVTVVGLAV